jgi:hypothetical protein
MTLNIEREKLKKIIHEELAKALHAFVGEPITDNHMRNVAAVTATQLRNLYEMGYIPEVPEIRVIVNPADPSMLTLHYVNEYGEARPLGEWLDKVRLEWYSIKITQN